jgi:UDP-3-O-[3-hydroxymyristoyl] N-acetylglucosamine deacetylase
VRQQTIAEKVSCTGIGLHSGHPVNLSLLPAGAGTGIVFVRTDRDRPIEIPARAGAVRSTRLATTLGKGDVTIGTVEHLLAALYGLGIDNIRVEVDGPEVPVMDGSAAPFVYLLRSAGVHPQRAARPVMRVRRAVEIRRNDQHIRVEPGRGFRVHYAVEFDHPSIRRQELRFDSRRASHFDAEIAGARTFGFLEDVEALRQSGLALGGSLENSVVLDDDGVMNPEGLRWPDEFVRHKILDLFGDLSLLGMPIQGHVHVERGGHDLHLALVHALLDSPGSWRIQDSERRLGLAVDRSPLASAVEG